LVVDGSPFTTVIADTLVAAPVSLTVLRPAGTSIGRLQCPIGTGGTLVENPLPAGPVTVNPKLPVKPESGALLLHTSRYPVTGSSLNVTVTAVDGSVLFGTLTTADPADVFDETSALPGSAVMFETL
jgi:hypothetical protein